MSSQLNDAQKKAVESESEVILCLAGAGTGKTSTLTNRIAHLHENRVGCSSMLALTFTRLAGKEMKERVINLIGPEGEKLFCNTFHAFCVKVLKEYGYLLGYDKEFTIYDQEDRDSIIEKITYDYGYKTTLKKVLDVIESGVNDGIENDVVSEYNWILKRNNALDLDMLLTETLKLLTEYPEVQRNYHNQYEYMFVDEFQDTNDIQMQIIKAINSKNLFVVGDDFQAIYGWRRAKTEYIINFLKYYPNAEIIKLEENYRSTEQIITAANNLIAHNVNQTKKVLKAHKTGAEIEYIKAENIGNEVNIIAGKILEDSQYSNYAILTRTNKQMEPFIQTFKAFNIPYQVLSNKEDPLKKYDVRMILSILEVVLNPKDDNTLKKVINFPVRRINELKLQQIEKVMVDESISFAEALEDVEEVQGFMQRLDSIHTYITEECSEASKVFSTAVSTSGLIKKYEKENRENKLDDIDRAFEVIERWENIQRELGESTDISNFLKWVHMKDIQEKLMEQRDAVKIMTVHGSKGLEFNTVFVVGMNQSVFPSKRGDLEEERRLFYVAITRAKEKLCITRAKKTLDWRGKEVDTIESKFIKEMN
ncbi:ATP-dependent helicase [Clostridium botulinum]|uniref:ATP-dependent helicase n=1 Tax=Clostridium botulinum TaxID=1491 RepID=UPI0013F00255|nr:UvrD-helicase domain-containing protein [Clostridium botulinum]MBY6950309.1 UvrD-helicase domain-containing protein [Clostridium botulinum]MCR1138558.1 UvrD-helicase domain-containing protein [Clostridium botulinum]NEZ80090.1 ATP-dependent helicase [Clostridium botulinum]NFA16751.1 ATP-dependent helicase [Clostridium botulinum]NFA54156.1 ATP-dependent helicase [Clostridium botulinum]